MRLGKVRGYLMARKGLVKEHVNEHLASVSFEGIEEFYLERYQESTKRAFVIEYDYTRLIMTYLK